MDSTRPAPDTSGPNGCTRSVAVLRQDHSRSVALVSQLRTLGIPAVEVGSTLLLSKLLGANLVELVVIDNQLEGFLTGLEIIQKMRKALIRVPVVLIDANSGRLREEVNDLAVAFADDEATIDELVTIVRRTMSRPQRNCDRIPERARMLVDRQVDFPMLSQLLLRLIDYLHAPIDDVSIEEMSRDISVDPKATLILLRAANAASNGLALKATRVRDAVRLLGVRRSIGFLLNAAITDCSRMLTHGLPLVDQTWHVRRAVLMASTTATFAEDLEQQSLGSAHVLGLFQDVGMLVLLRTRTAEYHGLLDRWRSVGHLKLGALERTTLGCTHAEVSAAMLERWGLPPSLIIPVLHHLEPAKDAAGLGIDPWIYRVMAISEAVADMIDSPDAKRRHSLDNLLFQYGPKQASACHEALMTCTRQAAEALRLLDLPLPNVDELEATVRSALEHEFGDVDRVECPRGDDPFPSDAQPEHVSKSV